MSNSVFTRYQGQRVLFISTKNADYIRNTQEVRDIGAVAESITVVASDSKSYLRRLCYVYSWLLLHSTSYKHFDAIFVGFSPQLVVPIFWPKFKIGGGTLAIDFFISVYDTMVFDRKRFSAKSPMGWICYFVDWYTLRWCSQVIADTAAHADYFASAFGVSRDQIEVMYLEADESIYHPMDCPRPPEYEGKYLVLYFGSVLPLQGVDVILDAVQLLADHDELRIEVIGPVGEGVPAQPNAKYISWLSQEELAEHISWANLCLAGHFNASIDKAKRTIPGKAYIYEAMGKPMILGDNPATHELYTADERHHFVEMGDPKALAELVLRCAATEKP